MSKKLQDFTLIYLSSIQTETYNNQVKQEHQAAIFENQRNKVSGKKVDYKFNSSK